MVAGRPLHKPMALAVLDKACANAHRPGQAGLGSVSAQPPVQG